MVQNLVYDEMKTAIPIQSPITATLSFCEKFVRYEKCASLRARTMRDTKLRLSFDHKGAQFLDIKCILLLDFLQYSLASREVARFYGNLTFF